ncbi:phosphonate ABC transporter, permease protein PhnE [Corynebacterium doosanense]|uniref:Phosphonate ABC transporter permease n=1 Tax=Corynebacterium doosanense CAU 212 = DSM 45436 TaxID=558173 RepID=A0A097IFQ7_9CORY|nr:phosphonate ABC transporter, permease protein PhnE [Corynebacterium doosanense]AIT60959.1 phosphonate ABC transporter permease [Corynebacterium doosanense CAU 212 = DSM 45436]
MTTTLERPRREIPDVPRPAPSISNFGVGLVLLLLVVGGIWSIISLGINPGAIIDSVDNAARFVQRMFPLDFPPLGETFRLVAETLAIVFLATVLAVILSIPAAIFAAKPTTSGPAMRWISRALIVVARALPDLILAIIFLRMFGLGPLAGILAMGIHSVGMCGKLYSDAIEELDDGPSQAIRASGGTRNQQVWSATVIQLLPQIIATALHRFDINLRASVLLGYVGVGGIGLAISESLGTLNYQRGMALSLIVLVLCILIEFLSGAIRAAIMQGSASKPAARALWSDKAVARLRRGSTPATPVSEQRLTPPWDGDRVSRLLSVVVILDLMVLSFMQVEIRWRDFFLGLLDVPQTLSLFFPPSMKENILESVFDAMVTTIQIALAATLIGSVLAIPIGILAARNVVGNKYVSGFFRGLIVVIRGIPELILAIIFVVISGLGGVAGTLALSVGAVGLLSKLLADSIEETDVKVQDAIRSNGASKVQVFFASTVFQSLPPLIAHVMYLLDNNIRSATLIGVVGAGGIGFLLLNASRVNQFPVVTTILLAMIVVVLAVEALSIWMRNTVR